MRSNIWQLQAVQLENFGSFVDKQTITFQSSSCHYILGENLDENNKADSNGSGKTTLLNAIIWGLYGKTAAGLLGSDLITHGAKKMTVVLFFNGLEVTREYSKSQVLSWKFEGDSPITGDVKVMQSKLEEDVLGMNYNVFLNVCTMFSNSKAGKFLAATPGDRAAILGDLVDDYVFQLAAKDMKRDLDWYTNELQSGATLKHHYQQTLAQKEAQLIEVVKQYDVEKLHEQTRRTQVEMKVAELENRGRVLLNQIATPPGSQKELEAAFYLAQKNLAQLQKDLTEIEVSLRQGESHLYEGSTCPTCKRYVDSKTVGELRLIHEEETKAYHQKSQEVTGANYALQQAQQKYQEFANWVTIERQARAELSTIQERLHELNDQLNTNPLKHLDQLKHSLTEEIRQLYDKIEEVNKKLDTYHYNYNLLQTLYPGFRNEIKNILFDQIRGELEGHVYTYSLQLGGDMFRITFPSKTHTNREKFEILIESDGFLQDLSAYSNGEAWRASFAVLLGLRLVMMRKHNARLNMLLIDDPIGNLDKRGITEFFQAISQIQANEKNLILVTIPLAEVSPVTGRTMTVTKQNRRSVVQ